MNVSSATWRELSGLLDEALDLAPPQRAAWLQCQRIVGLGGRMRGE